MCQITRGVAEILRLHETDWTFIPYGGIWVLSSAERSANQESPMATSPRTLFVAMLCALALLASACGGGSTDSTDVVAGDDASESSDAGTTSTSSEPAEVVESPIADLLGIPLGDDGAAQDYFNDLGRQAEILVAECMLAQGFEYQVVDYSQFDSFDANIDFESREFAEEYGFGIASDPFGESFEAFEAFEDPNQAFVETLTEGEREAYEMALIGELPESEEDFQSFEPGGCQGEAFEQVFAFGRVFEEFGDAFEEIEAAFEADPRIVGASTGWAGCMSEAGHSYSDPDSAEFDIRQRHSAIVQDSFAVPIPLDAEEDEVVGVPFGPDALDPETQALVDELAVEERSVALASWECNEPLRAIEDEVRIEYEQRFVDQNGAAIREALGE